MSPFLHGAWLFLLLAAGQLVLIGCTGPQSWPASNGACRCPKTKDAKTKTDTGTAKGKKEKRASKRLVLRAASFDKIPGWQKDPVGDALVAFRRSCRYLLRKKRRVPMGPGGMAGKVADWIKPCKKALALDSKAHDKVRSFFERRFLPWLATNKGNPVGLFSGYYEALMHGARKKKGRYKHPIYKRPPDLVMVYMKDFHKYPRPRRIAGRVVGGRLRPYATRAEIMAGALAGRGLELFWITDPIDAFFAEIQGSGIVELPDGRRVRVGCAGQNGHPYTAIGRVLVKAGQIPPKKLSMQRIRAWLRKHPKRAAALMNRNLSFVFFEEVDLGGALGSHRIVLTPERSVAIDPFFVPLSIPIFVDTIVPVPKGKGKTAPWQHLVIAQDTGGGIRGPVRGDLFFGAGDRAEALAGHLRHPGKYYLLLPKQITPPAHLLRPSIPNKPK